MAGFGFVPVPRDPQKILSGYTKESPYVPLAQLRVPSTKLCLAIEHYAREELSRQTYDHSTRVYFYGEAIMKHHFPDWDHNAEAYYLTCMLHDIGTTDKNIKATKVSFEYYGGMLAHNLIVQHGGSQNLAETVTEAIIRHQDFIENGMITSNGQLLQLTTILDNMGLHSQLVHPKTIEEISLSYPRNKWTGCFADVVKTEIKLKPWSHTTSMGPSENAIVAGVLDNKLMEPYD